MRLAVSVCAVVMPARPRVRKREAFSFDGQAIYTNFRQCQTGGRLIEP